MKAYRWWGIRHARFFFWWCAVNLIHWAFGESVGPGRVNAWLLDIWYGRD